MPHNYQHFLAQLPQLIHLQQFLENCLLLILQTNLQNEAITKKAISKGKFKKYDIDNTFKTPYNTHARSIINSGNDSIRKINSEKLLYILKNVLLTYFRKSKFADFWTKFDFYKGIKFFTFSKESELDLNTPLACHTCK